MERSFLESCEEESHDGDEDEGGSEDKDDEGEDDDEGVVRDVAEADDENCDE